MVYGKYRSFNHSGEIIKMVTTHPPLRRSSELPATHVACDKLPDKGRLIGGNISR